jgi:predicted membrane channel-forming protein YqfA (hemolysin III family)
MNQELEPRSRPTVGIFMIMGVIAIWALLIASLADVVGRWPGLAQLLFYVVAGLIWILPLKPIMRWSETGRWRDERPKS